MSGSANVKYKPLSQSTPSDDEDEGFDDNVLFDSRLVNGPSMDRINVFELERLGEERDEDSYSVLHRGRGRRWCVLITVLMVILLGAVAAVLFPLLNHAVNHGLVFSTNANVSGQDWNRLFNNTWTESSVRILDVDGDGLDDIIIGVVDQSHMLSVLSRPSNMSLRQFCSRKGMQYPCGGSVVALRGYDGKEIWKSATRSVVIYQNCIDIDVDGDRVKDCIVTGRGSTCQALNIQNGKLLWVVDPNESPWSSHFVAKWNVYQAITVPDIDSDGVLDIVVSHGGDKDKEPWDKRRMPGRLILLSGKTGVPIGNHFLQLPEGQETYMPPVKYITGTGAIYILYGSGGETVSGHLMAISLPDLYLAVTGKPVSSLDLSTYTWLNTKERNGDGVAILYSTFTKGIMVPPVLVDIDSDGTRDILVTSFDGYLTMLDGKTLTVKWTQSFPDMETYSSPTPGFYNADSVLDFMVHLNAGVWDRYNSSQTLVVSGIDGSTLWSAQARSYAYSSDLSLRTTVDNADVFLLKLVGRNSSGCCGEQGIGLRRRHLDPSSGIGNDRFSSTMTVEQFQTMCSQVEQDVAANNPICFQDLHALTQEVFLLDRYVSGTPLKILDEKASRHHYQLKHEPGDYHCHPLAQRHKDKIDMCVVLQPSSYTGAVGDVDGDGFLDYIHISQLTGFMRSDTLAITDSISKVKLSKHNLQQVISKGEFVSLNLMEDSMNSQHREPSKHFTSVQFLISSLQVWTQYLGSRGSSWYYSPP